MWKKIPGYRQYCTLPVCTFSERNMLHFELSKNNKSRFYRCWTVINSTSKSWFCHFCEILPFLLTAQYYVLCSKNIHTNRKQHFLCLGFFLSFWNFEINNVKLSKNSTWAKWIGAWLRANAVTPRDCEGGHCLVHRGRRADRRGDHTIEQGEKREVSHLNG
jgi:hypothetical protein